MHIHIFYSNTEQLHGKALHFAVLRAAQPFGQVVCNGNAVPIGYAERCRYAAKPLRAARFVNIYVIRQFKHHVHPRNSVNGEKQRTQRRAKQLYYRFNGFLHTQHTSKKHLGAKLHGAYCLICRALLCSAAACKIKFYRQFFP